MWNRQNRSGSGSSPCCTPKKNGKVDISNWQGLHYQCVPELPCYQDPPPPQSSQEPGQRTHRYLSFNSCLCTCSSDTAERKCDPSMFQCENGECILAGWRCDGDSDCFDVTDESNCTRKCPPPGLVASGIRKIIFQIMWRAIFFYITGCFWVHTTSLSPPDNLEPEVTCPPGHFQCRYGECIPARWKCDSEFDCSDQSDEENCCK